MPKLVANDGEPAKGGHETTPGTRERRNDAAPVVGLLA
jgi:hypothetical protein